MGGGSYSTSEIDTGETWIDGKKIYKKTFTGNSVAAGDVAIEQNTTTAETLIKKEVSYFTYNGTDFQEYWAGSSDYLFALTSVPSNYIMIYKVGPRAYTRWAVTVYYTKP